MSNLRKQFHDIYTGILDRNIYSQDYRQYVLTPKSDGKYYSDCSSSGAAIFQKLGIDIGLLNTAGMHYSSKAKKVNVRIIDGHIVDEDVKQLKVGMCLMYAGSDPQRPLQIGHVEYVYEINGTSSESMITICGHGSNTPSLKNLKSYNDLRYSQKASNGVRKQLVEVLDFLPDEEHYDKLGWNKDEIGWWYADSHETYISKSWLKTDGCWYYFNEKGYAVTGCHMIDGKRYFFEDTAGSDYECAMMVTAPDGPLVISIT